MPERKRGMYKYRKLKSRILEASYTQGEIAENLGMSMSYMSKRFVGKEAFALSHVYAICDMLEIPYSEIPEYFPPDECEDYRRHTK